MEGLCPTYIYVFIHEKHFKKQSSIRAQSCDHTLLGPVLTAPAEMLQQQNLYVQSFLTLREWAFEERESSNYKMIVHAGKKPEA